VRRAGQERGFISFVGLLILSVVSFFGVAAFTINEKEFETTRRFLNAVPLQMEAQNGILAVADFIDRDPAAWDKIQRASGEAVEILQLQNSTEKIACTVYAKQKADHILLLAVSEKSDGRSRAVAHLVKRNGHFIIEHWEH